MKFVWLIMPKPESDADKAKEKPTGGASSIEAAPGRVKLSEIGADMKTYIEGFEKMDEKTKQEFQKKTQEWDQTGNIDQIRRAGVDAAVNEKDPLKKHELLSALYLDRDKKSSTKMSVRVNFMGNSLAERKVGAGDLLPITVKAIRVQYADGRVIERALRTINPTTGRIGYYNAEALRQGIYEYVPVFTGTTIDVCETLTAEDTALIRGRFRENMEIYSPPPRVSPVSTPGYTGGGGTPAYSPSPGPEPRGQSKTGPGLSKVGPAPGRGVDKAYWSRNVEIVYHETFMGCEIKGGINRRILPPLRKAEAEIRAAGITYNFYDIQCFNDRDVYDMPGVKSNHAYGIAIDVNPKDNPPKQAWDNLDPSKRVPKEVVAIMERNGFRWLGRPGSRQDAMHFDYIGPVDTGGAGTAIAAVPESPGEIQHHLTRDVNVIAGDHKANAGKMKITPEAERRLARFRERAMANRARYESVSASTGIPWPLIAAIHERESGGNFNTYLHNGDPLGKPTVHVPVGKLFYDWESAAIDALNSIPLRSKLGLNPDTKDMGAMLAYAEAYNGLGYRKPNIGRPSPYVYAGTNIYQGGKYVRDGVYDPNAWDKQLGVASMLLALAGPEDYGPEKPNQAVA